MLKSEEILKDVKYEKPEIEEIEKMTFMFDWMKNFSEKGKIACRQCSSCHGCR